VSRVYVEGMETRQIAALSNVAHETAVAGDEVARGIFFQAGLELAEAVEATIRRLGLFQVEVPVSYQGSVLESCGLLRERFVERLTQRVPRARVTAPEFEPVVGAFLLGCRSLGWEFDSSVRRELKNRSR
jgi:N-acetylglucosamine kinase-like BadF-type ATPase